MGPRVRSKILPNMVGELVEKYENGNYLIKISSSKYVYGHKDYWEVVL